MHRFCGSLMALFLLGLAGCASPAPAPRATLEQQVAATERAFARSMAERDFAAFEAPLAEDTVFFSGPTPLRGKAQVAAYWQRFFDKPEAPFSWAPEQVEALESGTLALSTGPVYAPSGEKIGIYTSIWQRQSDGTWRVIFDRGCDVCRDCPAD